MRAYPASAFPHVDNHSIDPAHNLQGYGPARRGSRTLAPRQSAVLAGEIALVKVLRVQCSAARGGEACDLREADKLGGRY